MLIGVVALSGCAQYQELSPNWSHQGTQLGRLGFHSIETDGHASFRLQPTSGVLVAYQASPFLMQAGSIDNPRLAGIKQADQDHASRVEATEQPVLIPEAPISEVPPVEAISVVHWIAQAQAEVFRYYLADAQVLQVTLPQAFSEARARGLPTLFFVRVHQVSAADLVASNCRPVDQGQVFDADANQQTPMAVSTVLAQRDCHVTLGSPIQRVRLSFWLYDVQSQSVLHTGHMKVQSLMAAQSPADVLKLVAPSMQQLVRHWVAVSW